MTTVDEALKDARKQIDIIDDIILESLNKRAKMSLRVAAIKQQHDASLSNIVDPEREQTIIQNMLDKNDGPLSNEQIESLFKLIIEQSRKLQQESSS